MRRAIHSLALLLLLVACGWNTQLPATSSPAQPTRASTLANPPPSTLIPTQTTKPSSSPQPVNGHSPAATAVVSPTPAPGWTTYSNEYLGYSLHYPAGGSLYEAGFAGMNVEEIIPAGFTFDEYFDYVNEILPESLCVSVSIPGATVTISPPAPIGGYVGPCPGMGIGSDYTMQRTSETWQIDGWEFTDKGGTQLYLKNNGDFYAEFFMFVLENGFRVVYNGIPRGEMSNKSYQAQKGIARGILASLHWFRVPDLTKPGTTCAGKYTHLVAGTTAVVAGAPTDPPNRVRLGPGTSFEVVGQVYPGTRLKVVEGPVCADDLVFWRVENALIPGGSGWTAEGDGTDYWLEPAKP